MPTYEYACTSCGHEFETVQSIHDPSLTECPDCGGKLRKRFGNVGVVFKGSGFYRTDSKAEQKKKSAAGPKEPAAKDTAASGDKSASGGASKGDSGSAGSSSSSASSDSGSKTGSAPAKKSPPPAKS